MPLRRSLLIVLTAGLAGLPEELRACLVAPHFTVVNRGTRPVRSLRVTGRPLSSPAGDQAQAEQLQEIPVELRPEGLAPGETIIVQAGNCRQRYDIVATFDDGGVVRFLDQVGSQELAVADPPSRPPARPSRSPAARPASAR